MSKNRELTDREIEFLTDFAISHGISNKDLTERRLLTYYFSIMRGMSESNEELFSWFRLRNDEEDDYLSIAKDIVEEYGEEFLAKAEIIEVGSGILPSLSERLLELVPGISRITVYDPALVATEEDLKLHPNPNARKIELKREKFTPETPIDESRPTLLISRHPCGGTPALIEVAGKHIGVELYAVLCDCNDDDLKNNTYYYYRDRGEETPNYQSSKYSKIRIFNNRHHHEYNWQQFYAMKLKRLRPDAISKTISQLSVDGNVLLTKPDSEVHSRTR